MSRSPVHIPDGLLVSGPNGGGIGYLGDHSVLALLDEATTGLALESGRLAWCPQIDGVANTVAVLQDGRVTRCVLADDNLDLHDLLPAEGGWYVAATMSNAVLRLDESGQVTQRWDFGGEPDAMHLNSLCLHEGRLLASAFGRFTLHREYKGRTQGAGLVLDVETGETIFDGLSQPHSLVSSEDGLYYCNSEQNEVVRRGADGKETRVTLAGYTRGLWVADRFVYVGLSLSRNPSRDVSVDQFESAVVAILRRDDLEVVGHVPLPWAEIYDIRPLASPELLQQLVALGLERRDLQLKAFEQVAEPVPQNAVGVDAQLNEMKAQLVSAIGENGEQLGELRTQLVAAISEHITRMQSEHARMLEASGELQAELAVVKMQLDEARSRAGRAEALVSDGAHAEVLDRAQRAEALARWSVQVWGAATEQRQAMEALTDAVTGMDGRLVAAISNDISQMRAAYTKLLDASGALQSELATVQGRLIETTARAERAEALQSTFVEFQQTSERRQATIDALRIQLAAIENERATLSERLAIAENGLRMAESEARVVQDEMIVLRHEAISLHHQGETLQQVLRSASWRYTRPLRLLARLVRYGLRPDDRARLGAAARRAALMLPMPSSVRIRLLARFRSAPETPVPLDTLPTSGELVRSGATLVPALAGVADVFVWSVIDWHFRTQRPQHLARALAAKGHRVFYLSNNLVDASEPGYSLEPLDDGGRLFQVHLNVAGAPSIYLGQPTARQTQQLRASLAVLLSWACTSKSTSLVQHPFWFETAQSLPNSQLVYDCMDHHAGFENNTSAVLEAERVLVERADLVVASSAWLESELSKSNGHVALIRNATEFEHFNVRPEQVFIDPDGRKVIGYYGAIAEWFDIELVERVAASHPDALVLLIGCDTAGAGARLTELPNVVFTGEVSYADLPYWLHGFDVCLLPFRVLPLTIATNPVKIYEYLSAGKPVVAVDLPEMAQFDGLIAVASDHEEFVAAVTRTLSAQTDEAHAAARMQFAAGQTWGHRAAAFDEALEQIREAKVSIVVLTYNNLAFTDACLFSIDAYSDYDDLEVIVVDNASTDGSREFLSEWVKGKPNRKLILNDENRGFSAGNNQGLAIATGDVLVLLNNDTYVTPGWVRTMLWHLRRDPAVGLIGPVTNNIGNEARIEIAYGDISEMIRNAAEHTRANPGKAFPIGMVAFFCVMMRREVYEQIGGLDEAFGIGFFEDDDYCRRVTNAGWKVACAEDVFVHHHLSASFDQLKSELRTELFERNKATYEAKWGPWAPHVYRERLVEDRHGN